MYGAIRYIKFSGNYDNFYDWKEDTKAQGHLEVPNKRMEDSQ